MKKNEESLPDYGAQHKPIYTYKIFRSSRVKERKFILKNHDRKFLKLGRKFNIHIHESQKTPYRLNIKFSLRYAIIKLSKVKDKENYESSKRNMSHYIKGNFFRTISRLSSRKLSPEEKGR